MPIATGLALGLGATMAGGSIAGSAIASRGAGKAADQQSQAAIDAAKINAASQDKALAETRRQFDIQQGNLAPWLESGKYGITTLADLLDKGQNGTGPLAPWTGTFKPPTMADLTDSSNPNYSGYQFTLDQGKKAIEASAAAKGGLFSGGTGKQLANFAEEAGARYSDDEYTKAFQRYLQGYNEFSNNSTSTFNRYATLAGIGQTATQQANLSSSNEAQDVGNIIMAGGQNQAQAQQFSAAARASGYNATGNIWGQTINNVGGLPLTLAELLAKH